MDIFMEIHKKQFDIGEKIEDIIDKYEILYFALKYAVENNENIYSLLNPADEIYQLMQNLQNSEEQL